MQFGLFSNGARQNNLAADSYDADLHEVLVADEVGFHEAWISEHIGVPRPDPQPCPELFIVKAATLTRHLRFGAAVRNVPLYHPLDIATSAATLDQLTRGRYMLGVGTGSPVWGNFQRRNLSNEGADRQAMLFEALEYIHQCWASTEPFDWEGHWPGQGIICVPKPYQQPHPPLAVATYTEETIRLAGERGYYWLLGHYEGLAKVRRLAAVYDEGARAAGHESSRAPLRLGRVIAVAESNEQALAEWRADLEAEITRMVRHVPFLLAEFAPQGGTVEDVTFDFLRDSGVLIVGDPDFVYQRLRETWDEVGGWGTLLLTCGKDWATPEARERSFRLFGEHVMPRLAPLEPPTVASTPEPTPVGAAVSPY